MALPDGRHADYVYDASNNLIQAISTTGQISTFGYDIYSYMTSMTTPKQGTTVIGFEFGTAHHLGSITDALGNTRRYAFVSNGEVTKITDSKGGETVFHNAYPGFTQSIRK